MAFIRYHHTDRDRVCKMCGDKMARGTWGVAFIDVHVPPKMVTLHFHEGCLYRALDDANVQHATVV